MNSMVKLTFTVSINKMQKRLPSEQNGGASSALTMFTRPNAFAGKNLSVVRPISMPLHSEGNLCCWQAVFRQHFT